MVIDYTFEPSCVVSCAEEFDASAKFDEKTVCSQTITKALHA